VVLGADAPTLVPGLAGSPTPLPTTAPPPPAGSITAAGVPCVD
jgi:hypothetical protein